MYEDVPNFFVRSLYLQKVFDVFVECGGECEVMESPVFSSRVMIEIDEILDRESRSHVFDVLLVPHDGNTNHLSKRNIIIYNNNNNKNNNNRMLCSEILIIVF